MENKEEKLQEQEAPLKNSDDAFVQVGHNGEPVIPKTDKKSNEQSRVEKPTTLDKR